MTGSDDKGRVADQGSVGLAIRCSPDLRDKLRLAANLQGVTLQSLVIEACEQYLGGLDAETLIAQMQRKLNG